MFGIEHLADPVSVRWWYFVRCYECGGVSGVYDSRSVAYRVGCSHTEEVHRKAAA